MKTVVCRGCGKKIAVYWWRKIYDWQTGEGTIERYCPDCAACMVDERRTNYLLRSDVIEPAED